MYLSKCGYKSNWVEYNILCACPYVCGFYKVFVHNIHLSFLLYRRFIFIQHKMYIVSRLLVYYLCICIIGRRSAECINIE